jgi:hypothetical protein
MPRCFARCSETPVSTFARYLQTGVLPPPDKKLGTLNRWFETTMAAAVEALPKARERQLKASGQLEGGSHASL